MKTENELIKDIDEYIKALKEPKCYPYSTQDGLILIISLLKYILERDKEEKK